MTNYAKFKKKLRQQANQFVYNGLKRKILDCPDWTCNQYIMDLAKTFMKCGKLSAVEFNDYYTLYLNDTNYNGYLKIAEENDNKRITISLSTKHGKTSNLMRKEILIEDDQITMIDTAQYDSSVASLSTTSVSLFKNSCVVNELGEMDLVYRINTKKYIENGETKDTLEEIRIKSNGEALTNIRTTAINVRDEQQKETKNFKTNQEASYTLADALNGVVLTLEKNEIIGEEAADSFILEWLQENPLEEVGKVMKYAPTIN